MSGAKVKRPGLGRLMKDARKHLFDVVLVWRFDRFARSVLYLVKTLEEFRHVHDRRAFAELERCIIVERVTAGVRQAMKKRKYWGPMPIEQADPTITTSIQKLLREGMGCHKIGKWLGVSSRTVWKVLQRGRAV